MNGACNRNRTGNRAKTDTGRRNAAFMIRMLSEWVTTEKLLPMCHRLHNSIR